MKLTATQDRTDVLINQLLFIWESSVRATHHFLTEEHIHQISQYVPTALKNISHLIIASREPDHTPIAFMGIESQKLEMLFVDSHERGKGVGTQLLQHGLTHYAVHELCVNEQNPAARGFYEHHGFQVFKRTECDEQGNPFPLLYMHLKK